MSAHDREHVKNHPFNQRKKNKGGTRRHGDARAIEHAKRVMRLRRATARMRQLDLFGSRWERIKHGLNSEWFKMTIFVLVVLGTVAWSAQESHTWRFVESWWLE